MAMVGGCLHIGQLQHEWHWLDHVLLVSHHEDTLGLGLAGDWVSGETNVLLNGILITNLEHLLHCTPSGGNEEQIISIHSHSHE